MRFLFVHQNFPGQFRHVMRALSEDPRHEVVGIGDARTVTPGRAANGRLRVLAYPSPRGGNPGTHPYLKDFEGQVRRGQALFRAAAQLQRSGFEPDVVVVHPGWGEALFLRELFPSARHIHYCEYFFHAEGGDVGFDPEFPACADSRAAVPFRNSAQLLGLTRCDAGISPTHWQRSRYPAEFQDAIRVLHEGIDTERVRPDPTAELTLGAHVFRAGDEIVTYVARNLEPYRGFHVFMRALPGLQALRPQAQVLIVGGDEVSYGRRPPGGETYRATCQAELGDRVDWSRVHFTGKLPYDQYLKVLQVSAAHVYLTYPFVLSWSLLEAMASGCLIIASDTAPVREMITHGEHGLLTDFFDRGRLARQVADALAAPRAFDAMRAQARDFVTAHFDLHTRCLPAWIDFLTEPRP